MAAIQTTIDEPETAAGWAITEHPSWPNSHACSSSSTGLRSERSVPLATDLRFTGLPATDVRGDRRYELERVSPEDRFRSWRSR